MQRFLLPLVAALGLILLATVAYLVWDSPAEQAGSTPTASTAAPEAASDEPDTPAQIASPDAVEGLAPRAEADAVAPTVRDEEWADSETVDVAVSVVLPEGTPADDATEVLVFREAIDTRGLERELRQLDRERRGAGERTSRLKAVEPLPPSGALTIPMPKAAGTAHLIVRGRYSFTAHTIPLSLADASPSIVLEPELGIWVTGRVVPPAGADEEQSKVTDLEVELSANIMEALGGGGFQLAAQRDFNPDIDTNADEQGEFEFWGVPTKVSYRASGMPKKLAAFKTEYIEAQPGEHVELEIPLQYGGQIIGRVLDQNGDPVPEADLAVEQDPMFFGQGGVEVRDGETDGNGDFHLYGVASGASVIRIEKDGYLESSHELEVTEGEVHRGLVLELSSGNRVAGRVTWPDGSPAVGADVEVDFDANELMGLGAFNAMQGAEGDTETDAKGDFVVSGLGAGPFSVTVDARPRDAGEDADRRSHWRASADGVAPDTIDLSLVLAAPLGVSGVVVDDLGEPVTEFKVRATSQRGGMLAGLVGERESQDFENEKGEFELLGLAPGDWGIVATGDAYGRSEETIVSLPGEGTQSLVITLPRAASVAGKVVDPDGNPVGGAKVGPVFGMNNMAALRDNDEKVEAVADEQGNFVLAGVPAGAFPIEATAEGFAPSEELTVEAEPAQAVEGIVLTLRVGGVLTGEVFTPEGEHDVGRQILAQVPTAILNQRWATTDSEGHFRFEHMKPGTWQVMTFGSGGSLPPGAEDTDPDNDISALLSDMKFSMAEVRDGEETHVVLGAPPEDPVVVTGEVTVDGEPVADAFVTFVADQSGEEGAVGGMQAMKFKTTNSEGRYKVDLDGPGAYLVNIQKVGSAGTQQTIAFNVEIPKNRDEVEHDFELPVGGIAGTVYGVDGKPAGNARVSLSKDGAIPNGMLVGERFTEAVTDSKGRYEMIWLNPGKYTVSAGGSLMGGLFGTETTQARQVRSGLSVGKGQFVEGVDFHLERPGTIEGKVVDESGQGVANASIFVRDEEGNVLERMSAAASDSGGNFKYEGLAAGRYVVDARGSGLASREGTPVSVREGETASNVTVPVQQGTMLIVSLVREDDLPVQASISVVDPYGRQVNGMVSFNELMEAFNSGAFSTREQRIGPLPPGRYKVEATTPEGKTYKKPVTLNGQAERKLKVRIKK